MDYGINKGCPRVHYIKDNGVMVVSELIKGRSVAPSCYNSEVIITGYTDFSGWGNIIEEDGTGIKYVVDTETKSFGYRGKMQYFPNLSQLKSEIKAKRNEHIKELYSYLVDRWQALSSDTLESKTFTIKI